MDNNCQLAELLFPDVTGTISEYEKMYPPRELPLNAMVTRFAPSPTGFLHIGGISTALISMTLARQSKGVFFVRIEDTDKKREVGHGIDEIITNLHNFNIIPDEGFITSDRIKGLYGPYKQSERVMIYRTFAKELVRLGLAYPCFCSPEVLEKSRSEQIALKIRPGYYGKWAHHRNMTLDEVKQKIEQHEQFVLRIRAPEISDKKVTCIDLIKDKVELPVNDVDAVLLKSSSLPTYHFAHVIDDYLMRVTHVIRGDEWLSSLPIHLQLFEYFKLSPPRYGHIAPISKIEGKSKRKLSKRKDPEAAISYYYKKGYPPKGVIEYLFNLINSSFYPWRINHLAESVERFPFSVKNMSPSGAMFDCVKLDNICKNVIASMNVTEAYEQLVNWAMVNDTDFGMVLKKEKEYTLQILNIERTEQKKRKDIAYWSAVKENFGFFFDDLFKDMSKAKFSYPSEIPQDDVRKILSYFADQKELSNLKENWLKSTRSFFESLGYAPNMKIFKADPVNFKGIISGPFMVLRIALTGKTQTPDLYEIMKIMGIERVQQRLQAARNTGF